MVCIDCCWYGCECLFVQTHVKKVRLLYFAAGHPDYEQIGNVPSVVFYGTDRLREDPAFEFEAYWQRNKILQWLWFPIERYLIRRVGVGFRLDQALIHLSRIRRHDVILAETDSTGLPLLLLKRLGLIKSRVGFISAGLINELEHQQRTRLFGWYKWLLRAADFVVCWSPLEERMFRQLTGARATFVPLEADTVYYQPSPQTPTQDFILCVGRDVGRDFETLFEALTDTGVPAKVIASAHRVAGLAVPENVDLHTEKVDYQTLMDWYRQARLVIVNLQEIHRFTGQRALLEALAMGKATVAARTQALTSTYPLVDGRDVVFYEPGDASDLTQKIRKLYDDQKKIRDLGFSARQFVGSLPNGSFCHGVRALCVESLDD